MTADELRNCAAYVESATNAIEGADRGRELARLARRAAGDLDSYAKTIARIEEVDRRVVEVLTWMDERGRNSLSFGSHADAYEIAARRLREAMHDGTEIDSPKKSSSNSEPNFSDMADDGPTAA